MMNFLQLPASINVVYLGGVEDSTSATGQFSLGVKRGTCGSLADNCSAMVDPMLEGRRDIAGGGTRVWLGSLLPLEGCSISQQCNWGRGHLTPEEWGSNAAESLERIMLRYRMDGLDFNIEGGSHPNFGGYICSMFKHLERRMGPGLVYTLTPCCGLVTTYRQVAQQCGEPSSSKQQTTTHC